MANNNTTHQLEMLLKAKALYEAHPENSFLQEKELSIVAHQILSLQKEFAVPPTAEETSALEWAKRYLATV